MKTLLLVIALAAYDSMPPPTLLAPPRRDTLWVTPVNPLRDKEPYRPEDFVRVPKAILPRKKKSEP